MGQCTAYKGRVLAVVSWYSQLLSSESSISPHESNYTGLGTIHSLMYVGQFSTAHAAHTHGLALACIHEEYGCLVTGFERKKTLKWTNFQVLSSQSPHSLLYTYVRTCTCIVHHTHTHTHTHTHCVHQAGLGTDIHMDVNGRGLGWRVFPLKIYHNTIKLLKRKRKDMKPWCANTGLSPVLRDVGSTWTVPDIDDATLCVSSSTCIALNDATSGPALAVSELPTPHTDRHAMFIHARRTHWLWFSPVFQPVPSTALSEIRLHIFCIVLIWLIRLVAITRGRLPWPKEEVEGVRITRCLMCVNTTTLVSFEGRQGRIRVSGIVDHSLCQQLYSFEGNPDNREELEWVGPLIICSEYSTSLKAGHRWWNLAAMHTAKACISLFQWSTPLLHQHTTELGNRTPVQPPCLIHTHTPPSPSPIAISPSLWLSNVPLSQPTYVSYLLMHSLASLPTFIHCLLTTLA